MSMSQTTLWQAAAQLVPLCFDEPSSVSGTLGLLVLIVCSWPQAGLDRGHWAD